jgi:glycosyltransferase involved in cell wall biosynthesis
MEKSSPTLEELPDPPPGKTGWPWTEQSDPLPETQPNGEPWPKISIVTPSYNQGQFIEETIRSVLLQGYPNLEYIVIDGGSTDETVEILEKYDPWIDYWVSETDEGQSDAINKGFDVANGEFGNWQNSDDLYCRDALPSAAKRIRFRGNVFYIGICITIDRNGNRTGEQYGRVYSLSDLLDVPNVWRSGGAIPQSAVLFPLNAYHNVGGLDTDNRFTMDFHLWGKFFLDGLDIKYINIPIGMFRCYEDQKVAAHMKTTDSMVNSAISIVKENELASQKHQGQIIEYLRSYQRKKWENTGRLARTGLPRRFVEVIRKLKNILTFQA